MENILIDRNEELRKRRASQRMTQRRQANIHIGCLKNLTDEKISKINNEVASKTKREKDIMEMRQQEEERVRQETEERKQEEDRKKEEDAERERYLESRRWKPRTESDKFAYQLIQEWNGDFEKETEKFFHASFVLTWFIHRKFGICFTGGIERWGKDRGKLKPFGGRREDLTGAAKTQSKDGKETREETASRELREETIGLVDIKPAELTELPHVFILKTNPCYLYNVEVNHHDFRDRLKNEKNPNSLEMKAVVHIPFQQFYSMKFDQIPGKGVRVDDISGRSTEISAFFLHALRGFGFI